jgi:sugar/nucleoside kinase (ribokinase family)
MSAPRRRPGSPRLMLVGNIPMDITMRVGRLPRSGEDLRADGDPVVGPGGGFTVLAAARRAGLRGRFAGTHGTGPFGDQVRRGLRRIDCEVLLPALPDRDTGIVVGLVDALGERTFVSSTDAVVPLDGAVLTGLRPDPGDLVYVSGYSLGLGKASVPLARWVRALDTKHLLFVDLGPWGSRAPAEILDPVLERVDWLSCNASEAAAATGVTDPAEACRRLQSRTGDAIVLVRAGASGCWVCHPGRAPRLVATQTVDRIVDTTGAGDVHAGTFLAAVASTKTVRQAVVLANAAAAEAVTRPGAASWSVEESG